MREHKYRAWHKQQKRMYQVEEIRLCTEPYMQLKLAGESPITSFRVGDNVELMQCTGLKDVRDAEIYEGDIIKYGHLALNDVNKFGERPWENLPEGTKEDDITTVVRIIVVKGDIDNLYKLKSWLFANPDVLNGKIIGNIYENPELVPEAKQQ